MPRSKSRRKRSKSKGKKSKFQGTKLFLTWPQNETNKDTLIERLLEAYPNNIEWIVACNEDHEPTEIDKYGGMHSHVALRFKKARTWVYHKVLEEIGGKSGDYQCMKGTMYDAFTYIIKHGDYASWGFRNFEQTMISLKRKQSPKEGIIADMLYEGMSVRDVLEDPTIRGFAAFRLNRLKAMQQEFAQYRKADYKPKYGFDQNLSDECNESSKELYDEIIQNMNTPRKHRQKHIFIYTESGVGKTVLLEQLKRRCRVFSMPTKYPLEGYSDGTYDMMVAEEFRPGSCQLSLINNILGGGETSTGENRYGCATKTDNILTIIASNYTPSELYSNMCGQFAYRAFLTRFNFYQFTIDVPIRVWEDEEDDFTDLNDGKPIPDWAK